VPARAAFATGRYVHETRCWDNAIAYEGTPASWGHRLIERGHHVVSIGKLHYQDSDARRNGFSEEILPLHIVDGAGDLLGLIRDELPRRAGAARLGPEAGPANPNTRNTIATSPPRPATGCATRRRSMPTNRGRCTSASSRRISR